MPQLLFLPSQQCNGPPSSLWSQQWTGPPFSFWTQAPFAKVKSKKLSAMRSAIEAWCFAVYSIAAIRVLSPARVGRLERNLSARLIYLEIRKIGGWLESRRKFQMIALSLGSVSSCQDQEIFNISGTNALWANRGLTAREKWLTDRKDTKLYINQVNKCRSRVFVFLLKWHSGLCFFNKLGVFKLGGK